MKDKLLGFYLQFSNGRPNITFIALVEWLYCLSVGLIAEPLELGTACRQAPSRDRWKSGQPSLDLWLMQSWVGASIGFDGISHAQSLIKLLKMPFSVWTKGFSKSRQVLHCWATFSFLLLKMPFLGAQCPFVFCLKKEHPEAWSYGSLVRYLLYMWNNLDLILGIILNCQIRSVAIEYITNSHQHHHQNIRKPNHN